MWAFISQRNVIWKHGSRCDLLENSYVSYFRHYGLNVIPLPNVGQEVRGYIEAHPSVKRIILSGGNNISPSEYKGDCTDVSDTSPLRDGTERNLLEIAVEKRIPVLGICRGMQFINVFFGGSLIRKDTMQVDASRYDNERCHFLEFTDRRLRGHLPENKIRVNSFHDQAVSTKTLSSHLRVFALDSIAGTVEGLFHPDYPIAGVQFHPERDAETEEHSRIIIEAFIERKLFWR